MQANIRSYAKINLALNVIKKISNFHKIESIVSFISLHDEILIKKNIPVQAGLGGGSMNAASILNYLIKKKP